MFTYCIWLVLKSFPVAKSWGYTNNQPALLAGESPDEKLKVNKFGPSIEVDIMYIVTMFITVYTHQYVCALFYMIDDFMFKFRKCDLKPQHSGFQDPMGDQVFTIMQQAKLEDRTGKFARDCRPSPEPAFVLSHDWQLDDLSAFLQLTQHSTWEILMLRSLHIIICSWISAASWSFCWGVGLHGFTRLLQYLPIPVCEFSERLQFLEKWWSDIEVVIPRLIIAFTIGLFSTNLTIKSNDVETSAGGS